MIDYEEDWMVALLFRVRGSLVPRACCFSIPSCMITIGILYWQDNDAGRRESMGMFDLSSSQLWNCTTAMLTMLLAFRTRQGLMRFWQGTGLLHQMRGEWFDTVSNCVTFSISAKKRFPEEVQNFRHALVRLMSRCHGSALEEIAENSIVLQAIDTYGLDNGTLNHLRFCHEVHHFNKVEVMLHLVQSLITNAHDSGIMNIPPPILSRVYQTISRGFVNLLNAKKITDTRFPFPYVQLIATLLLTQTILTPLMMCSIIRSKILATAMTMIIITGMFSLNFISVELENPFGTDDNDLPMEHFQDEMNLCLLMLLHEHTDMIPSISHECITDFPSLISSMDMFRNESDSGSGGSGDRREPKRLSTMLFDDDPDNPIDGTVGIGIESTTPENLTAPSPEAAAPKAISTREVLMAKGLDDFQTTLKQWKESVEAQVTLMNQSFNALQNFNEATSEVIRSTDWNNLDPNPRQHTPEPGGWEASVSPL